ncbi:MAG: TVP38/TMEM64 family protein, partial [Alphaproteobacteria bacterium]
VRLRIFVVTTFFGIIPGALVYTSFGAGLGAIFDSGEEFSAAGLFKPEIVAGMVGLALLSLIPVGYRWWRQKNSS